MPTLSSESRALSFSSFVKIPNVARHQGMSGTKAVNTFLITVVRVMRLNDWNIMPMRRRKARKLLPCSVMTSVPSTVSVPSVMSCMRFIVRISVDFPAPDRPMMATNSPCSIVRFIFLSASKPFG